MAGKTDVKTSTCPKAKRLDAKICSNCGACFMRDRKREKNQKLNFCSLLCQRDFQKNNYFDYHPKAKRSEKKVDLDAAKKRWQKQRSLERRSNSAAFAWWKKCNASLSSIHSKVSVPWDNRIASAVSSLKSRAEPTLKLERVKMMTWDAALQNATKAFRVDLRSKEQRKWSMKINSAVKNLKRRFEAQSKRGIGNYGTSTAAVLRKSLLNAE